MRISRAIFNAQQKMGIVPPAEMFPEDPPDVVRIKELEKETGHDVVAFLRSLGGSRFIHYGITASDLVDTGFSLALREAGRLILRRMEDLYDALYDLAQREKYTVMVGRTHGVRAEPTTFGLRVLGWLAELERCQCRLEDEINEVSVGKVSGSVGNYAHTPPEVEAEVCRGLGLHPVQVATQIIPRDIYAGFFVALAMIAVCLERIAVSIRLSSITEVGEMEEGEAGQRVGSSSMPHKRNPVGCENICGLARVVRSNLMAVLESSAVWWERDISHSSVERIVAPDSTALVEYTVQRMTGIIRNLRVNEGRIRRNSDDPTIHSQASAMRLIRNGMSREEAETMVINDEVLNTPFPNSYYTKHVDHIFEGFDAN
jgi:adenylosuccinate lyase